MSAATNCPNCDSDDLSWSLDTQVMAAGILDGRLRLHDVRPVLVQSCNYCSETVEVLTDDDMGRVRVS